MRDLRLAENEWETRDAVAELAAGIEPLAQLTRLDVRGVGGAPLATALKGKSSLRWLGLSDERAGASLPPLPQLQALVFEPGGDECRQGSCDLAEAEARLEECTALTRLELPPVISSQDACSLKLTALQQLQHLDLSAVVLDFTFAGNSAYAEEAPAEEAWDAYMPTGRTQHATHGLRALACLTNLTYLKLGEDLANEVPYDEWLMGRVLAHAIAGMPHLAELHVPFDLAEQPDLARAWGRAPALHTLVCHLHQDDMLCADAPPAAPRLRGLRRLEVTQTCERVGWGRCAVSALRLCRAALELTQLTRLAIEISAIRAMKGMRYYGGDSEDLRKTGGGKPSLEHPVHVWLLLCCCCAASASC
jgi:hypothetical protein